MNTDPDDTASPSHNLGPGLTKREFFAAQALQGILAQETESWSFSTEEALCEKAVIYADSLIAALNKS